MWKSGTIDSLRSALIFGLAFAVAAGAAARITSLELKSGGRGIALVINGDAEFPADALVPVAHKNGSRYTVAVTVPQSVCGMRLRHFTVFPQGSLVSDIVVKEKPSSAVEIVMSMAVAPDKAPIVRNKEMRQLILISSRACAESEWLSTSAIDVPPKPAVSEVKPPAAAKPARKEVPPAPIAAAPDPAPIPVSPAHQVAPAPIDNEPGSLLSDIAVLQRGDVAQIMFNVSGPFSYELKSARQQMVLTLSGAANGLGTSSFKIHNSPVTGISVKEKKHAGTAACVVTIMLEPGTSASSYTFGSANRLIIMIPAAARNRFVVWSAVRNKLISADWAVPPEATIPPPAIGAGSAAESPVLAAGKSSPVKSAAVAEPGRSVIPEVRPSPVAPSSAGTSQIRGNAQNPATAMVVPQGRDTVAVKPAPVDSVKYTAYGRDPFMPYMMENDPTLPSVDNLKLVGVLFGNTDRIALLQDRIDTRRAYALRELDVVKDGSVMRINRTNVIFLLTEMGISRTFSLELPGDNTIVKTY